MGSQPRCVCYSRKEEEGRQRCNCAQTRSYLLSRNTEHGEQELEWSFFILTNRLVVVSWYKNKQKIVMYHFNNVNNFE